MAIALVLTLLAAASAAVLAYGTDPVWARYHHGIDFIILSRQYQWLLVTLTIAFCVLLIGRVMMGKNRKWWLIVLEPILMLLVHRFRLAPAADAKVVFENPPVVDVSISFAAGEAGISDDDWVVAVDVPLPATGPGSRAASEVAYVYPYETLFGAPVVIQSVSETRMILLWSAYANRVLAFRIADSIKAKGLEVVSMPANALLVYDSRHGQFINGVTGLTISGAQPTGFLAPLLTTKTTWKKWRATHSSGKLILSDPRVSGPRQPIAPAYPIPQGALSGPASPAGTRVDVVESTPRAAIETTLVGEDPVNLQGGTTPLVLLHKDSAMPPRAFVAQIAGPAARTSALILPMTAPPGTAPDARPIVPGSPWFGPAQGDAHHHDATVHEVVGDTVWSADGTGISRTRTAGKRLTPVPVDTDVDWAVMHYWCPGLNLQMPIPAPQQSESAQAPDPGAAHRASHRRRLRDGS